MLRLLLALILAVTGWLLPGGQVVALPTIGVTIDGGTVTSQLQSATWNLGISNFLADLSPNTASLSFKGQLSVSPADSVVITAGGTAMWTGRLDSAVEVRDVNGDYWTSVSATDTIGALGAARLRNITPGTSLELDTEIEARAATAGVTIDVVDSSSGGLVSLNPPAGTFDGPLLEYMNLLARTSNAMLALQRDGKIKAWVREKMAEDFITNHSFDVDLTGWTAYNSSTISRQTSAPYAGAGNLQIISGTGFGGAQYAVTGTLKKDHAYRLRFWAKATAGSSDWWMDLEGAGLGSGFTPTSSWAMYSVIWTPTADDTSPVVIIRDTDTTTGTLQVDSVTLTEVVNATDVSASIVEWEKTTSVDVDINRWLGFISGGGGGTTVDEDDAADIAIYGERAYDGTPDGWETTPDCPLVDWYTYGGSQRPIVTRGELVVSSSTSALLALDPLDWVNDGTDDWQIMSMTWSATPGEPWRLTITADNLIYLLRGY